MIRENFNQDEEIQEKGQGGSIRVSDMPVALRGHMQELVKEFDADGDGRIDIKEFVEAIKSLRNSRKKNKNYVRIILGLSVAAVMLIGSIFGLSFVAANLSKDTSINGNSMLVDKHTGSGIATSEAIDWLDTEVTNLEVVDMTANQLMHLKQLVLFEGNVRFHVKGHTRTPSGDKVIILVEGGTITYDAIGMLNATGDARDMLDVAFGITDIDETEDGESNGRRLRYDCNHNSKRRRDLGDEFHRRKLCGGGILPSNGGGGRGRDPGSSSDADSGSSSGAGSGSSGSSAPARPVSPNYGFSAFDLWCLKQDRGQGALC